FLEVRPGQMVAQRTYVPLRLEVSDRATTLTFKIAVVAEPVAEPLLALPRRVIVKVFDARGELAWASGELAFAPRAGVPAKEVLLAKVPRGGQYTVAVHDAATAYSVASAAVEVDVLDGGDFEF